MSLPSAPRMRDAARAVAAGLALGYGLGTAALVVDHDDRVTSYFSASAAGAVAGLTAGLSLLLVGLVAGHVRPLGLVGTLVAFAGVVWLLPVWVGWEAGPRLVRASAELAVPLLAPLLVHLMLLSPRGRLRTQRDRHLVVGCYTTFLALVLGRALLRDPLRDRFCWVRCGEDADVFLVWPDVALARALGDTALLLTILVAAVCAVGAPIRVWRRDQWSAVTPLRVAVLLALTGEATYAAMVLTEPAERFSGEVGATLFLLRAAALVGVAAATGGWAARHYTTRRRMARLALELGESPRPGELEAALAGWLRDETLRVRYWLPRSGRLVDGQGRSSELEPADRRARTTLVRGPEPLAVVLHDDERVAADAIERGFGAAARMVVDNERLRAEQLAQLRDLQESRARIVAATDTHRARLEQDLHDGAQQRLIAATFELRLARDEAESAGNTKLSAALDEVIAQLVTSLDKLRDFAHGVFPAVLDESGVAEALWSLTDTAPVAVELDCRVDRRLPQELERTLYLLVKAAVEAPAPASPLDVHVADEAEHVLVEVHGVGRVEVSHLADRVGAVGGELEIEGGTMRAVIPCG